MVINIDTTKTFKFILEQTEKIDDLTNKEITLMIMAIEHLKATNKISFTMNLAGVGAGALTSFIATLTSPYLFASGATLALATGINAIKKFKVNYHLSEINDLLTGVLLSRFDNFLEAYMESAKLITSIETEDLIDFFNRAGAINE